MWSHDGIQSVVKSSPHPEIPCSNVTWLNFLRFSFRQDTSLSIREFSFQQNAWGGRGGGETKKIN